MEEIHFKPRKKFRKAPFIAISIALICMIAFLAVKNKDDIINMMGLAVREEQFAAQEEPAAESSEETYIAEDKTPDGLVVKYGNMEQSVAEAGLPVRWEQEIIVENPSDNAVRNATLSFFVPKEAKNTVIFLDERQISSTATVVILEVKPNDSIVLKIAFETSPVQMEFVEENGATKVRLWQDSGMIYRNIPVEMDVRFGEKIVESIDGSEKEIVFDSANGKARWTIKEI